jgi:FMN-dependent NADH-azoreductase
MTTVFRLDSSIRVEGSITRAIADTLESALASHLDPADGLTVIRRDVGQSPLPATLWPLSMASGFTPADRRTTAQAEASAQATKLADELVQSDAYIFTMPLYNFGVSQHLKAWFDVLITEPRFAPRTSTIPGRPAFVIVARGGAYGAGSPRDGWDHATAWVKRILADVWGLDVQIIECELTLAPGRPEMADFQALAAENLVNAKELAVKLGSQLAERLNRTVTA